MRVAGSGRATRRTHASGAVLRIIASDFDKP